MSEDDWKPDPVTYLFPLGIGAFAWQVHGVWVAIALAIAYVAVVIANNFRILASKNEDSGDPFRRLHRWKWVLFVVFMIGIALSGAELVSV